jgi:hypothetical protein
MSEPLFTLGYMTDLSEYEKKDPNFIDDLKNSQDHVAKVASWLSRRNDVIIMPTRIRPSVDVMRDFSDCGDLLIHDKRIEVKQRKNISFGVNRKYPYTTAIVDVCHTFDDAIIKPFAYVVTNKDVSSCFIAYGSDSTKWKKEPRMDRHKGRERWFYFTPKIDMLGMNGHPPEWPSSYGSWQQPTCPRCKVRRAPFVGLTDLGDGIMRVGIWCRACRKWISFVRSDFDTIVAAGMTYVDPIGFQQIKIPTA